jgi:Tfp pilus assembly protein PilV
MEAQHTSAGFGTIDAIVALSLFSFVVLSVVGLLIGSMSAGATAEGFSIASSLARERLDQVASDIAQRGGPSAYPPAVVVGGRTYTVTSTQADLGSNLTDVTVQVDFQTAFGSACAESPGGQTCAGNVRTYSRMVQTRVRRP